VSVHETVAVTDGVVGESLIAESNVASRHSLINGVPGNIQDLMMASDVPADRSGIAASSGVPRNFVRGCSTNSVDREQRERGSRGGCPLVRGSGGSCNLVQEIPFHIVKFS
jgi:hypothetical protein